MSSYILWATVSRKCYLNADEIHSLFIILIQSKFNLSRKLKSMLQEHFTLQEFKGKKYNSLILTWLSLQAVTAKT